MPGLWTRPVCGLLGASWAAGGEWQESSTSCLPSPLPPLVHGKVVFMKPAPGAKEVGTTALKDIHALIPGTFETYLISKIGLCGCDEVKGLETRRISCVTCMGPKRHHEGPYEREAEGDLPQAEGETAL